jgi:hypothetical protein
MSTEEVTIPDEDMTVARKLKSMADFQSLMWGLIRSQDAECRTLHERVCEIEVKLGIAKAPFPRCTED